MTRPRFGPILLTLALTLQATWYILLLATYIHTPANVEGADFISLYSAGRIAASGQYSLLYDLPTQMEVQGLLLGRSIQSGQFLSFYHPPLLVPILRIICTENYLSSYLRWLGVLVCILVAVAILINQLLKAIRWKNSERVIFITACMLFYPTFISVLKGQDTALLLLGGMLWMYGLFMEKDPLAGLGLAMLVIRPQIALVLAIPFLFKRRRVWWWFCACALALAIYSFILVGLKGTQGFIHLTFLSAGGEGYGINLNAMFNLIGMLVRIFPHADLGFVQNFSWIFYLSAIIGLSILWGHVSKIELWHLVLASSISVFISPHLHYHDLSFLLLPILGASLTIAPRFQPGRSRIILAVLPVVCSLALLFADLWDPARFTIPYLLMLALPVLSWFYTTHPPAEEVPTV